MLILSQSVINCYDFANISSHISLFFLISITVTLDWT